MRLEKVEVVEEGKGAVENKPFLRAFCFSSFRCWAAGFWARSLSLAIIECVEESYKSFWNAFRRRGDKRVVRYRPVSSI